MSWLESGQSSFWSGRSLLSSTASKRKEERETEKITVSEEEWGPGDEVSEKSRVSVPLLIYFGT